MIHYNDPECIIANRAIKINNIDLEGHNYINKVVEIQMEERWELLLNQVEFELNNLLEGFELMLLFGDSLRFKLLPTGGSTEYTLLLNKKEFCTPDKTKIKAVLSQDAIQGKESVIHLRDNNNNDFFIYLKNGNNKDFSLRDLAFLLLSLPRESAQQDSSLEERIVELPKVMLSGEERLNKMIGVFELLLPPGNSLKFNEGGFLELNGQELYTSQGAKIKLEMFDLFDHSDGVPMIIFHLECGKGINFPFRDLGHLLLSILEANKAAAIQESKSRESVARINHNNRPQDIESVDQVLALRNLGLRAEEAKDNIRHDDPNGLMANRAIKINNINLRVNHYIDSLEIRRQISGPDRVENLRIEIQLDLNEFIKDFELLLPFGNSLGFKLQPINYSKLQPNGCCRAEYALLLNGRVFYTPANTRIKAMLSYNAAESEKSSIIRAIYSKTFRYEEVPDLFIHLRNSNNKIIPLRELVILLLSWQKDYPSQEREVEWQREIVLSQERLDRMIKLLELLLPPGNSLKFNEGRFLELNGQELYTSQGVKAKFELSTMFDNLTHPKIECHFKDNSNFSFRDLGHLLLSILEANKAIGTQESEVREAGVLGNNNNQWQDKRSIGLAETVTGVELPMQRPRIEGGVTNKLEDEGLTQVGHNNQLQDRERVGQKLVRTLNSTMRKMMGLPKLSQGLAKERGAPDVKLSQINSVESGILPRAGNSLARANGLEI